MNCPTCKHVMVKAKPGFMCLNCGQLISRKPSKSHQTAATTKPTRPTHQAAAHNPTDTIKPRPTLSTKPKSKTVKTMDITVRVK